jgi:hypothetical protein
MAPCSESASSANWEQLGKKRQARGSRGETSSRYPWRSARSTTALRNLSVVSAPLWNEPERFGELACCVIIGELSCARLRDHHQIDRYHVRSPVTKHLSQKPLDAIALYRIPYARAHGDAETRQIRLATTANEHEMRSVTTRAVPLDGQELSPATEP